MGRISFLNLDTRGKRLESFVDRELTNRVASVVAGLAVGAGLGAGVLLRTAPALAGWQVDGGRCNIAAAGEVGLRAGDAGDGREGDQKL